MIWWILIPGGIAAVLAYGWWEHGKQGRHLSSLFAALSRTEGGHIKAATFLGLPQFTFERDGVRYRLGAMASGGANVSGSASRPGFNGPFTFADLALPANTGHELRVLRNDALDRQLARVRDAIPGLEVVRTGDPDFDNQFRINAGDKVFVARVVDAGLRRQLLDSQQQKLELAISGDRVSVHIDDYAQSAAQLEEMIAIAATLAKNSGATS